MNPNHVAIVKKNIPGRASSLQKPCSGNVHCVLEKQVATASWTRKRGADKKDIGSDGGNKLLGLNIALWDS